ncbi:hypothetical protein FM042_03350 [Aliidiomarina halalkaliphila]|uniref:Uncharacterized protein n=1 Tax=Aliidiomarina halalkaliphila TaxID=2593535 RepID=A0A552X4D9_9GAMM|nr:hypothetical protein [Aliidiomarina halalkaliphila]TRW49901.1 hypothetical protein FM042_03350 [Aliidiomarina halalkaliphila]
MKKLYLALPLVFAFSACGDDNDSGNANANDGNSDISSYNDIDFVKSQKTEFDDGITLGDALESWVSCKDTYWEEQDTDIDARAVRFTCELKISDYMSALKRLLPEDQANAEHLDISSRAQAFTFLIEPDGNLRFGIANGYITWADGLSSENFRVTEQYMAKVFANEHLFDANELTADSAAEAYEELESERHVAEIHNRLFGGD